MQSIKPSHVPQRDATDCGVACLLAVLRSFGGNTSLEQLRELSGTTSTGTTLLGIYQAAKKIGIQAEGFEADVAHLKTIETPAILHIIKNEMQLHYIVCYGYNEIADKFTISDPAESKLQSYTPEELEAIWQTKTLLLLKSTAELKQTAHQDTFWSKMRWLYDFVKTDLDLLTTSFLLGVLISALGLSVAIFSQKLVDNILPARDMTKLIVGCGLLFFLLFLRAAFAYIRQLFLLRQTKDFNIRIVDYFYKTLLSLPKSFFDTRKTGDLVARMNDTSRIQQTITNVFTNLAIEIVVIIASTAVLFSYHILIGFISLLWLPIFTYIVYRYHYKIIEGQRNVMSSYAYNESNYIDTIQGIGAIKVANREPYFAQLTQNVYTTFQDARYQLGLTGNNFSTVSQFASTVFIVGIILSSSLLVLNGAISIGAVMAITQLITMMMASASTIAVINIGLQEAKVALDRMQEFTTLPAEYNETTEITKEVITNFESLKIAKLNFRFTGRPLLLRNITLEVNKGEIVAILGESGGGKSTLLQIIQQFYTPENGTIQVNGLPLGNISVTNWRKLLGVVPQDIKIFNGFLFDNILLAQPTEAEAEKLIHFFREYGFDTFFEKFPQSYGTLLGETGVNLSGGQKQMVALARALYHKPQVLLLDEATSAMDKHTEQIILNLLSRLKNDMAIILVTHRSRAAAIADRVYQIENGEMMEYVKEEATEAVY